VLATKINGVRLDWPANPINPNSYKESPACSAGCWYLTTGSKAGITPPILSLNSLNTAKNSIKGAVFELVTKYSLRDARDWSTDSGADPFQAGAYRITDRRQRDNGLEFRQLQQVRHKSFN